MNWDTIFTTGMHESSSGQVRNWIREDLDKLVKNTGDNAPIVIHHPKDQDKAFDFGKIATLRRQDDLLQARYKDVPEILKIAVDEGLKLDKSVSIDPVKMEIRHVGLLGAGQEPMVKGLGSVNFAEDKGKSILTYLFSQPIDKVNAMDPKDKKIQELENKIKSLEAGKQTETLQQEITQTQKELKDEKEAHKAIKDEFIKFKKDQADNSLKARIDVLAEKGKIKPANKDKVLGFAKAMASEEATMEFAAADGTKEKVTPQENYLRDLESRPENNDGLLSEFASADHAGPAADDSNVFEDINKFA